MKAAAIFLCFMLVPAVALAGTISATEAGSHVGQTMTVESVVSGVHVARSGATFIDMGGSYPNQAFTGVIFSENSAAVGDVSGLTGKTIDLTGTIQMYRGKPEIILRSADQIRAR
jgi:hypothetical protein